MTSAPVAFVSGASRGLGLLIARDLARRGHTVAITGRTRETLDRAAASAAADGFDLRPYVADAADRDAVAETVRRVEAEVGPIEVAIHVAGVIQVGPLQSTTLELFDTAIDIMLRGPIHLAWAVLPGMRARRRGRIGTVTSIGGKISVPHMLPYSVAKFGAVGFSEGLSAELAGTGVTATTIVPGLMRTGSPLQAQFVGQAGLEYAWFAPSASLPLISMDAERAARSMVDGVLSGKPVVTLSPLAHIGARFHGLAPATTVRLLGVMNRVLPGPGRARPGVAIPGYEARRDLRARSRVGAAVIDALTVLGNRAARRNNELSSRP